MQDSFVHKGKRKILVEYLRNRIGISDENVLSAMSEVPRHLFIESIFEDFAYEDRAFPILAHQTISHPSTVAEQSGDWNRMWIPDRSFNGDESPCLYGGKAERSV